MGELLLTILIGGARGIGLAVATGYAEAGAQVYMPQAASLCPGMDRTVTDTD
jgi:NAD(P)-dependent dehydrogenase (short-subunit alcohol dehydrogenase family)